MPGSSEEIGYGYVDGKGGRMSVTEASLKIEPTKIKELVEDYRSGRLVIPGVSARITSGERNKAPKLLDSLYRNFPIAALLTWQSSEYAIARRRNSEDRATVEICGG
jgi:hypothetical protein